MTQAVQDSISIIKESFDNEATPYFALIICLWGKYSTGIWLKYSLHVDINSNDQGAGLFNFTTMLFLFIYLFIYYLFF